MPQGVQVRTALEAIEQEMKRHRLWQAATPSAEALASVQPFCCDTLAFEQWLQFVLLPRMHALLDAGAALPTQVSVCPMAEEAFRGQRQLMPLIERIADLDELLSGRRVRES
ncbi:YqcC family protein [Ferrimonas balearica]|uniref:YqcC family protein n=1 Tax=Ferrimonas balearica TaxID=44012 RepID=UPI001C998F90|nr:YqcC family protein [Ferrimonas balearica]MBY5990648.1 YqcC family protein [Ferrimonas balearica]